MFKLPRITMLKSKNKNILTTTDLADLLRKTTKVGPYVSQENELGSFLKLLTTQCVLHPYRSIDGEAVLSIEKISKTILGVLGRYKGFLVSAKFSMNKSGVFIITLVHYKDLSMSQVLVDEPGPTYAERYHEKLGELLVIEYDFIKKY